MLYIVITGKVKNVGKKILPTRKSCWKRACVKLFGEMDAVEGGHSRDVAPVAEAQHEASPNANTSNDPENTNDQGQHLQSYDSYIFLTYIYKYNFISII